MRIRDVIEANLETTINEIIKLSDAEERHVAEEINHYVITRDIESHLSNILRRLERGMKEGEQNVGFWVSGFYGSGKSSLVKVLSYALENVSLLGRPASALLLERTSGSKELTRLLGEVVARRPVIVRFDLQGDRDLTAFDNEPFSAIAWRAIRRALGYADSLRLSELEIRLEEENALDAFVTAYDGKFGAGAWKRQKHKEEPGLDNASAVLHQLQPDVYPSADSWASRERAVQLTANTLPGRASALVDRRIGPGRPLILVADEVGHFIGRSPDRMQDVQGLVEALGRELRGRAWFFVTAQERLDAVFMALPGATSEKQRNQLPHLRDRFMQIDLAPKDIGEVTQQRLLRKAPTGATELAQRYQQTKEALRTHTELTGAAAFATSPDLATLSERNFVSFYPFLPYQVDLIIHIISGIRDQGGIHRLTGGAARTLIRLVQDVLTHHPRLKLAERPLGELVTLDVVYDQQEANLPGERRSDLDAIKTAFSDDAFTLKVAKALCVLEYADARAGAGGEGKGLVPRTPENLAAVLHPAVDAPSQRAAVEASLQKLQEKGKARRTPGGWELLTPASEKWESERGRLKLLAETREAEVKDALKRLVEEDSSWRHPSGRKFTAGWTLDAKALFAGAKDLRIELRRTSGRKLDDVVQLAESDTRKDPLAICWVLANDAELDDLADEIGRSAKMIAQYETQAGPVYAKLLHDERGRLDECRRQLRQTAQAALAGGTLVFGGNPMPIAQLGPSVSEAVRRALELLIQHQFKDYELASMSVDDGLIRSMLESPLDSLPDTLRGIEGGLDLFARDQGRTVVRADGKLAAVVLNAIGAIGRKGQDLERELYRAPYGWTEETVRLITAALFRGGQVQVTHKGRTLTVPSERGGVEPFTQRSSFAAAVFSRRSDGVDNRARVAAAKALAAMGETATPDEADIHRAVQRAAKRLRETLVRLEGQLSALSLPGGEAVRRAADKLSELTEMSAVEATRELAVSGADLADKVDGAEKLARALTSEAVGRLHAARDATTRLWPELQAAGGTPDTLGADAEKLKGWLTREGLLERLPDVARITGAIGAAHEERRAALASQRAAAYHERLERLRADAGFTALAKQDAPRAKRIASALETRSRPAPPGAGGPGLAELGADIAAADARLSEAIIEVQRALAPPEEPPEVIPVRRYLSGVISDEVELRQRIETLHDACVRALRRQRKVVLE